MMNKIIFDEDAVTRTMSRINLVPVLFIGAVLSISLSISTLWFVALLVLTIAAAFRYTRSFIRAFIQLLPVVVFLMLLFLYSSIVRLDTSSVASRFNIASWALLLLIVATAYHEYGIGYFEKGARQLGFVLLCLGLLGIIEGIISYNPLVNVFTHIQGSWRMGTDSYRASSIFSHPIPFAHMMLIGFAIFAHLYDGPALHKIAAFMVFFLAIIESQTRSALFLFAFLVVLFGVRGALRSRNKVIPKAMVLVVCIICIVALIVLATGVGLPVIQGILDRVASLGDSDVSVTQRVGAIELVLGEIVVRGPIELLVGNGLAASNELINSTTISIGNFNTVDNNWLTVLFDLGVITFVAMVLLAIRGVYCFIFSQNRIEACYGCVVTISSLYMFFYSFTMWKCTVFILLLSYYVICSYGGNQTKLPEDNKLHISRAADSLERQAAYPRRDSEKPISPKGTWKVATAETPTFVGSSNDSNSNTILPFRSGV